MHNLLNATTAIVFALLLFTADKAITSAIARDTLRAVLYGIATIWLPVIAIVSLFGL